MLIIRNLNLITAFNPGPICRRFRTHSQNTPCAISHFWVCVVLRFTVLGWLKATVVKITQHIFRYAQRRHLPEIDLKTVRLPVHL